MPYTPSTIGKYQIRKVLGEGAMGVVYEGFDPHIERQVAIKTLHKHLIYDPDDSEDEYLKRFQREAKAAAKCIHPNIVLILEYGEDNGTPYIVMEYVTGQSLEQIFKSNQRISLQNILSIFSQVLKGLNAAHKQGVVHRDIKPANIMVIGQNSVKLADFGIARIDNNAELTQVGVAIGTPRYMAPEQLLGMKVDHRADVFSSTLIFIDLLMRMERADSIPLSTIPSIDGLPPNNKINHKVPVPTALIPIIKKGLSPNAEQRYSSVIELVKAIQKVLPELSNPSNNADNNNQSPSYDAQTIIIDKPVDNLATNLNNQQIDTIYDGSTLHDNVGMQTTMFELNSNIEDFVGQSTLVNGMDSDTFNELKSDLSQYIGDDAGERIMQESSNAISMAEIINSLAEDIPKKKQRQKFIDRWIQ